MKKIQVKCTNCGKILSVEKENKASICEYCKNAYVVEEALQLLSNTYNNTDPVAHVQEGKENDFEIIAGKLIKYKGASSVVTIPNNVTIIGENAFSKCEGLTSVSIPGSVKQINKEAFSWCDRLNAISFNNGLESIKDRAFRFCQSLEEIVLPSSILWIGNESFSLCRLKSIDFPEGLETIGDYAFSYNGFLSSVRIPSSVERIGSKAFAYCPELESVTIDGKVTIVSQDAFAACEKACFYGDNKGSYNTSKPIQRSLEEINREIWEERGRCIYCGGELKVKLFSTQCTSCFRRQ